MPADFRIIPVRLIRDQKGDAGISNQLTLIKNFAKRPLSEKVALIEAAFWLGLSRLAIALLPFRRIAPFLGQRRPVLAEETSIGRPEATLRIVRAIETMSRHLPWESKCLSKAISGKMMLRFRGIQSTLCLGLAKEDNNGLSAHAWLCTCDKILLGRQGMDRYTVIATFT